MKNIQEILVLENSYLTVHTWRAQKLLNLLP